MSPFDRPAAPPAHPSATLPRRNRPASLQCAGLAFPGARSFDLEVTPWAPTRLTSCIFHSGHTEAYGPLRSTRSAARAPFRDLAAPQSTRKPPVCRSGISKARSFDLEVTPWAPTRLTSCISHSSHLEAYEPLRSTRRPARAPFNHLAAPETARKPPVCRSGISRARSFDLEVTPWAPSRLTSCISHSGPEESSGASTLPPGPARPPSASNFPPNRPASPLLLTSPQEHARWLRQARLLQWQTEPSGRSGASNGYRHSSNSATARPGPCAAAAQPA